MALDSERLQIELFYLKKLHKLTSFLVIDINSRLENPIQIIKNFKSN